MGMIDGRHFMFWCQKVLPLVYDDSLSYYEVLCKVRDYLNNIIDDLKAVSDITDENQKQIAVINQEIEEINKEIDELVASGFMPSFGGTWDNTKSYLKYTIVYYSENGNSYMAKQDVPVGIAITNEDYWQIISNYSSQLNDILEQIAQIEEEVNTLKEYTAEKDLSESLWMQSHMFVSEAGTQPQGSCIVRINNVDYLFALFYAGSDSNDIIRKIRISDGVVTNSLTGYNFGHGNTLTYNEHDKRIYVTSVNTTTVKVIDAETMDYIGYVEFGHNVNMCSWYNGKFYCATPIANHHIYVYDEGDLINPIDDFDVEIGDSLWNGMFVDEKYIYISVLRNTSTGKGIDGVAVYFKNGVLKGVVESLSAFEIEDIAGMVDGKFYITAYSGGGMAGFFGKVFDDNITYNRAERTKVRRIKTASENFTYYLDKTYTGNLSDGSQSHPFKAVAQMIHFSYLVQPTDLTIYVIGDWSESTLRFEMLAQIKQFNIRGTGTIGGLVCFGAGNVMVQDITISNDNDTSQWQGMANIYYGRSTFTNVTFSGEGTNYAIYVNNSDITLEGCTFNSPYGIFVNNDGKVMVGTECVFNCDGRYFRAYKGGVIHLQGVDISIASKLAQNDDRCDIFDGSIVLKDNDDLDDILIGCKAVCSTGTIANTILNAPVGGKSFCVYTTYTINQNGLYQHFVNADLAEYVRCYSSGTWSNWKEINVVT